MQLIIVHYHLRPGGIRRVIELAAPHLVRALRADTITLACGEADDRAWNEGFAQALQPTAVEFQVRPAFNYLSEQSRTPAALRPAIVRAVDQLLANLTSRDGVVWAHNLGIARNLVLSAELARACEQRGIPLLSHHHDWWFDNRWLRWPEMRRSGATNLTAAARIVFPATPTIRHLAINHADAAVLRRHFPGRTQWLPNPASRARPPIRSRVQHAHRWLRTQLGGRNAPVWLLPCRLLRRKNIAEALLLTRWLRPETCLVTTGGVSSQDEQAYFHKLDLAARRHHWPLRLAVLARNEPHQPSVAELLAASECVLLTSIQEGFGLPYLEAAAAGRPLIARSLPNIAPDLAKFGFRFPQGYDEIHVPTNLFDWTAERARQAKKFDRWRKHLPAVLRRQAIKPVVLDTITKPEAVPFSRLTLPAQLEVLAHPVAASWKLCAPLNPFLHDWQRRAARNRLQVTTWPPAADRWLSGPAYARAFVRCLQRSASRPRPEASTRAQSDFFEKKLAAANSYPLLWNTDA